MKKTLSGPLIRKMQVRHFWLVDVLPLVVSLAAIPFLYLLNITWIDWCLFFVMWFLTEIGLEVGHHRYFSHRSFQTSSFMRGVLTVLASINGQGQVISWVTTHRFHHEVVDQEDDPHTPAHHQSLFYGFWFSHLFWKKSYPLADPQIYASDLLKDKLVYRVSKNYYQWIFLSFLLPALVGGLVHWSWQGFVVNFLLAGVIRLVVCQHSTFLVNSACHIWGSRPYTKENVGQSRNNLFLTIPTLGGSLHNNHHAFPAYANNAHEMTQFDPGFWVIWLLEKFGLVWGVKRPIKKARLNQDVL